MRKVFDPTRIPAYGITTELVVKICRQISPSNETASDYGQESILRFHHDMDTPITEFEILAAVVHRCREQRISIAEVRSFTVYTPQGAFTYTFDRKFLAGGDNCPVYDAALKYAVERQEEPTDTPLPLDLAQRSY